MQHILDDQNLVRILKGGGVAILPTDTIYGIVGTALNKETVKRIYEIKKRSGEKQCINLIGSLGELDKFEISLSEEQKNAIENFQDPTSFIIDSKSFRLPLNEELRGLLLKTGPLIAPSANPEGLPPAKDIEEAKKYFGDLVDLYVDGGELRGSPSKVIKLHRDGSASILRE